MKKLGRSIRNKVILVLAISVLVPALLFGTIYSGLIKKTIEDKVIPLAHSNFDNLSLNFSQQIKAYLSLVTEAATSQAVISIAEQTYGTDDRKKEKAVTACLAYLKSMDLKDRLIFPYSMLIVCRDGTLITPNVYSSGDVYGKLQETILSSDYYRQLKETGSGSAILTIQRNLYTSNSSDQVYFVHNVLDRQMDSCGVVMYCVDVRYLTSLLTSYNSARLSSLFLLDENGGLLLEGENNQYDFNTVPLQIEKGRIVSEAVTKTGSDGKRYLVMMNSIPLPGSGKVWNLCSVTKESDLLGEQREITVAVLFVTVIMLLLGIFCMGYIRKSVLDPVIYYSEKLRAVEGSSFNTELEARGRDEIWELGKDISEMLCRIEASVTELENKENEKRILEARMLSAQINPHFIRNTLNSIRITAEMNQAFGVAEMVRVFAHLIDYVFKRNAFSTVRAELAYLDDYMTLQNLRYQDKFVFIKEIDEVLMDQKIMSAVFQPVIENAIIHGFSGKKGTGTIWLRGHLEKKNMVFRIEDDGNGIEKDLPVEIREGSVHGLSNVLRRMQLGYGNSYGLKLESRKPCGVVVTIRIPYEGVGEDND